MLYHAFVIGSLTLAITSSVYAQETKTPEGSKNANPNEEETLVIGDRRSDFTIITDDTQKLVETAGSLGDPLSAVFSLPGVVSSDGDGGEPAVRGSSPSDNTYVVDFMPAGYIFHEFGVSIFSAFILQDFQLYSAGAGPEYSNVTGAAFDVRLRQPKNQAFSATADLSMLRSSLFLESGVTDNSAFYASYRISLIDRFINAEDASDEEDGIIIQQVPQDFDYQFKYAIDLGKNHRLNFSANGAGDKAAAELTEDYEFVKGNPDFAGDAEIENRNDGQNIVYEYSDLSGRALKAGIGSYTLEENTYWGDHFINEVTFDNLTYKLRYTHPLAQTHTVTIGAEQNSREFRYLIDEIHFVCTEFDATCDFGRRERIRVEDAFKVTDQLLYINDTWMPTDWFTLDAGLQWQSNDFNEDTFIHPRLAANITVNDDWSINAKTGQYNRFPELDTVIPNIGNPEIASPSSKHYVLGVENTIGNGWSWTLEGYYKTLDALPLALQSENDDDAVFYLSDTEGRAYGVDLLINKNKTDKWYSWLALSYGKSERTNLQTNETAEYHLDTPLIFNWVMNYQFTPSFNMGWRWTMRSGAAHTPIEGVAESRFFPDTIEPVYGDPYSTRLPYYSRLDLRFKWDFTAFNLASAFMIDIINATNHRNVIDRSLDYNQVNAPGDEVKTEDEIGIEIKPALTYRVRF